MEYIELNSAYPVKIGWRHISVRKIQEDTLTLCLIGKVGQNEEISLTLGETISLDEIDYKLLSVHHPAPVPDDEYAPQTPRRVVGIMAVVS